MRKLPAEQLLGALPKREAGRDERERQVGPHEEEQAQHGQRDQINGDVPAEHEKQGEDRGRRPQRRLRPRGFGVEPVEQPTRGPAPERPREDQPDDRRQERQRQQQPGNPGRRTLISPHPQPLQRPLPPAADRFQAHGVLSWRQAGRDRHPARRGQRIVQRQVGRSRLVAGQRVGRLAVHADPVVGPVGSALDAQIEPGASESEHQRVTVRTGIGGVRRHAPAAAVVQRGVVDGMLAGRQHRRRRSGPGQHGPHRPLCAAVSAERKAEPGIIRRAVGAIGGPEERPQPRPVRARPGKCPGRVFSLGGLADTAPGRPVRGQRVPAKGSRPQRRLIIPVTRHHLALQFGAAEVESFRISSGVRRLREAVGLRGRNVKPGPCAQAVQRVQEGDIAQVGPAGFRGGRQGGEHDLRIGVYGANLNGSLAQQPQVARRIDIGCAPVRGDVRLVPHLVIAQPITVALRHGRRERAEVGPFVRWRLGIVGVRFRPRPRRRAVQHDHRGQRRMLGELSEDRIPRRPIKLAARRFNRVPGQRKAHPADAPRLHIGEGAQETLGREFACLQVDAGSPAKL